MLQRGVRRGSASSSFQVVARAARPVSTPRCPPGAVSSFTAAALGNSSPTWWHGRDGRDPVAARRRSPAAGRVTSARSIVRSLERELAVGEVVGAEEAVVELAERAPRVGVHAAHERVDRLDLREQVAVVEVGGDRPRLHHVLVDAGELVAALDQRRRRAAERAVELRDQPAAGERVDRPQRRDQRDLGEVERARHQRDRPRPAARRRSRAASSAMIPPRHQPTAAPAGRRRPPPPRGSRVGITSSTQCSRPRSRSPYSICAVVEQVGAAAGGDQVLGERAAPPQVEADRRRGERRHEQHRRAAPAAPPSR